MCLLNQTVLLDKNKIKIKLILKQFVKMIKLNEKNYLFHLEPNHSHCLYHIES
jgi:hypothetical protein